MVMAEPMMVIMVTLIFTSSIVSLLDVSGIAIPVKKCIVFLPRRSARALASDWSSSDTKREAVYLSCLLTASATATASFVNNVSIALIDVCAVARLVTPSALT